MSDSRPCCLARSITSAISSPVAPAGKSSQVTPKRPRIRPINQIRMLRNTIGTITDPNTAWMLLRSLETLELRMTRAGENAAKVCAFLTDHAKVESVGYLGFLEQGGDARQADIYRRHCTGAALQIEREGRAGAGAVAARRRRSASSIRSRSPISRSAWAVPRRWPATRPA